MANEIMFICGKCGAEVDKEAVVCPKCKVKLGNIRCPFCKFIGSPNDFKNDRCPKCGRNKNLAINLKKNIKKPSPTVIDNSMYDESPDFFYKYFSVIFISMLIASAIILVFFLKHFNVI